MQVHHPREGLDKERAFVRESSITTTSTHDQDPDQKIRMRGKGSRGQSLFQGCSQGDDRLWEDAGIGGIESPNAAVVEEEADETYASLDRRIFFNNSGFGISIAEEHVLDIQDLAIEIIFGLFIVDLVISGLDRLGVPGQLHQVEDDLG